MQSRFAGVIAACGMAVSTTLLLTGCGPSGEISGGDLERVGASIARGEALVSVPALSQRIVEDRGDFRLIDLRPVIEFEDGHIPGAVSAGVTEIVRAGRARELAGNRQIVLYSADGVAASQAAALLQLQGVNAVSLQGGFLAWNAWSRDPSVELAGQAPVLSPAERQAMVQFFHGDVATPAATPAAGAGRAAALGLTPASPAAADLAVEVDDPLGLGLQFGLGVGIDFELPVAAEEEAPAAEAAPRRRLLIGEGC
ncbi:MAG: rhodanese-like domain-containing protein [Wenzhouxiangella sp.]